MANDQIGSMVSYAMLLHILILGISYWEMNEDIDNGSWFDLLAFFTSIDFSVENAIIGLCRAFALSVIVVGVASFISERDDKRFWNLITKTMTLLCATIIWGSAIVAMSKGYEAVYSKFSNVSDSY